MPTAGVRTKVTRQVPPHAGLPPQGFPIGVAAPPARADVARTRDTPGGEHEGVGRETGMATAEFAVAVPAVILVLALCLTGVSVGIDQVRCVDAARTGARALARGDEAAAVRAITARAGPRGAAVTLAGHGDEVVVTVSAERALPGTGPWGTLTIHATATAQREDRGAG